MHNFRPTSMPISNYQYFFSKEFRISLVKDIVKVKFMTLLTEPTNTQEIQLQPKERTVRGRC